MATHEQTSSVGKPASEMQKYENSIGFTSDLEVKYVSNFDLNPSCPLLYASQDYKVSSGERAIIPTDLQLDMPLGMYFQLFTLPEHNEEDIHVRAGVIDPSFRNAIAIILHNKSKKDLDVKKGNPIACGRFILYDSPDLSLLSESKDLEIPTKSEENAGYDLRSNVEITIPPDTIMEVELLPNLTKYKDFEVKSRSGFAAKGINAGLYNRINNTIQLHNTTEKDFKVNIKDRIAQMLFIKEICIPKMIKVENESHLSTSERGKKGFGSSGVQ